MWEFNSVEYLGVTIDLSGRNTIELNYTEKIQKLRSRLNPWLSHGLTPFGKVYLWKSEALSQLVYLMSVLPKPSAQHIKQSEK